MCSTKTPVDAALQPITFTSTVGIDYLLNIARDIVIKTSTVKDMRMELGVIGVIGMDTSIAIQLQFLAVNQAAKKAILVTNILVYTILVV